MTNKKGHGALFIPSTSWGVCLWKVDELFVKDEDNNYLSAEGTVGNAETEKRMRVAARSYLGHDRGQPHWIFDHRKVSDSEYEDQQARLAAGLIPDEVDLVRQVLRRKKK